MKNTGKTVAKKHALKSVRVAERVLSVDDNLKRLSKSPIPMNFVKKHNGAWNHQDWLDFLAEIDAKGYSPIDPDRVGLILEAKKASFLAR